MLIILASFFCGCAAAVIAYKGILALKKLQLEKRLRAGTSHLRQMKRKGLTDLALFIAEKTGDRLKKGRINYFHRNAAKLSENLLIVDGALNSLDPYTFTGIQLLAAAATPLFLCLLLDTWQPLLIVLFGILGFFIPAYLLQSAVKEKHKKLFRQIPDTLDLLSIMIEAGVDLSAALHKIIESEDGPLIQAFAAAEGEIRLGKPRHEAFESMAERLHCPALTTVVNAITLSLRTGTSLAPTLRALSEQFRVERFQLAEKMANEAPLKLMVPLVLLIFPTIFIILFGPILLSFTGSGLW